jgi:hypothetical protein
LAQLQISESGGGQLKMPFMAGALLKPTPQIDSPLTLLRPFQSGELLWTFRHYQLTIGKTLPPSIHSEELAPLTLLRPFQSGELLWTFRYYQLTRVKHYHPLAPLTLIRPFQSGKLLSVIHSQCN